MNQPWDVYGALPDFISLLRERGYEIGTEQTITAHRLLVALLASGDDLKKPRRLGPLLAPIFSTSPEEQKLFVPLFEWWLDSRPARLSKLRKAFPLHTPQPPPSVSGRAAPPVRTRVQKISVWLVYSLIPLIATGMILGSFFWNDPNGNGNKNGTGGGGNVTSRLPNSTATWWIIGVAGSGVLLFAASRHFRFRRPLQFSKGRASGSPALETLEVERALDDLAHVLALRRTAQRLRRRRQSGAADLDLHSTIDKTIRKGLFTPVYGSLKLVPEYLVLIDRKNFGDQLARLQDEIVKWLIRNDVHVERFYFQEDPRLCRRDGPRRQPKSQPESQPESETQPPPREDPRLRRQDGTHVQYFTLQELAARYPEHNLIMFSDGAGLFNPRTGLPQRWLKMLSPWVNRALLTTEPYEDDYRKRALSEQGFLVIPAGKLSMHALGELADGGRRHEADFSKYPEPLPLPAMLQEGSSRWLESHPPPKEITRELCAQVQDFLGAEVYRWFCACAVYPELQWELTMLLRDEEIAHKGLDEKLWSLVRLPWFQHGSMPDWLRHQLIIDMQGTYELQVREKLELLLKTSAHGAGGFHLHFTRWLRESGKKGWKESLAGLSPDFLKRRKKAEAEENSEQEYVFLSFMSGFRQDRLAILLPAEVRSVVLGNDKFVRELYWLNALMLGLLLIYLSLGVALVVGLGANAIFLVIWWAIAAPFAAVVYNVELQVLRYEKAALSSRGISVSQTEPAPNPGIPDFLTSLADMLRKPRAELAALSRKLLVKITAFRPVRVERKRRASVAKVSPGREPYTREVYKLAAKSDGEGMTGGQAEVPEFETRGVDVALAQTHPRGLYVLFLAEMWERFGFYSMLAMFTLYLRDPAEGFGWTAAEATSLYANYLMFVYLSPLVGGFIGDRKLGYLKSVMIGGLFFISGYFMLAFGSINLLYAALTCLVIGNGFFKPNVSTMVGKLYPEGSHLKDRAYNIFYMGINVGAFLAPLVAGWVRAKWGFHPAFAVAAGSMSISLLLLGTYKKYIEAAGRRVESEMTAADTTAVAVDVPPANPVRTWPLDAIPDWKRVGALNVIFLIVVVFWMVFHQNASTLTYFADANTDWTTIFSPETAAESGGIISNSINPFWAIMLTFPLVWFWGFLDKRGLEPSTPTKMAFGMTLTALSFFILYFAAKSGEATALGGDPYAFRVSPMWLVLSYFVVTLGELMLSPMGLSLVSKVAPIRLRGLMMGGWFVATGLGNKLTVIGIFWDRWLHSTFFLVLGLMALVMAVVLFLLLKPLKKVMPGV